MSLYVIGDLHLSLGTNKSMDVFDGWENYTDRIRDNWNNTVCNDDVVVVAGDSSWAMNLDESYKDFEFLNNLAGKKIVLKGNHDYWFTTVTKMEKFFKENNFNTLNILHNNAYQYDEWCICGTRGWISENGEPSDQKILAREAGRLEASLQDGVKMGLEPIVFLHYPPIYIHDENLSILEVLHRYNVKRCYYGHIHGDARKYAFSGVRDGIEYKLISSDHIDFTPVLVE